MSPSIIARLACGLACWSACFAGAQDAAIPAPNALGPADAPIEIVEYSDFQCPYSRKAWKVVRSVAERYPGKVRWVFKSFPLPFHPQAPLAHEAALVAGEWGRFWELHDRIFAAEGILDARTLIAMATEASIPPADFEAVLESRAFAAEVEREAAEGKARGVTGTPTFFVNGVALVGAQPAEVFEYLVRRALNLPVEAPAGIPASVLLTDPEPAHPFAWGPVDSTLVVKVFADLRSPLGLKAAPALAGIVREHLGKVRLVINCFATGIYADSAEAHEAAAALVTRGADFFEVWKRCSRPRGKLDAGAAGAIARELGLDEASAAAVEDDVRHGRQRRIFAADGRAAQGLDLRGSPVVFVGERRLDGLKGIEALPRAVLDVTSGRVAPPSSVASRPGSPALDGSCLEDVKDAAVIASAAETGASTALAADVFDFGEAARGAMVRHVFEVRSASSRPLRIVSTAIPSFLRVHEVPSEVAAGGVAPLAVDLPLASFTGVVDTPLSLATDDPAHPRLAYRIKGKVSDEVVLEPRAGLSLRVVGGDAGEAQAELLFRGEVPVEAFIAGCEVAGLEVTLDRIESGRRYRLRVKLPPGSRAGERKGVIALRTTHQRVNEVLVPVEVVVLPELIVTPPSLTLAAGAPTAWVRVQSARGLSLGVLDVRLDLAFLRAALVGGASRAASKRLVVEARLDQTPAANASGELILKVEKPWAGADRVEELRVPVRWRGIDK